MLDMNPDGLQDLNYVTATLIATGIALLGLMLAIGAVSLLVGRSGGLSHAQSKGLRMMGISLGGALILVSLGAGISWSIDRGTETLMNRDARQQDIVVERDAPSTTCVEQVSRDFEDEDASEEDRLAVLEAVTNDELIVNEDQGAANPGPFLFRDGADERSDAVLMEGEVEEITAISWYPDGGGGGCSEDNETATPDTVVNIEAVISGSDEEIEFTTAE